MNHSKLIVRVLCAGATLAVAPESHAQAVCSIPIETRVTDLTGVALEGPLDVEVTFYDGPDAEAVAVDCRAFSRVPLRDGWLRLSVDACALPEPGPSGCGVATVQEILRAGVAEGATVWMGIRIGEDIEDAAPRTRVGAVPYSVWSTTAGSADLARELEGFDPAEYAELADLASYATLADLDDYARLVDLASYATLADLEDLPTLDDVAALPTFDDLADYAPLATLDDYAPLAALDDYAPLAALDDYAPLAALDDYALSADLAAVAMSGSFDDLIDVPAGLSDGDDDTLAGMPCGPGQVAIMNAAGDAWECSDGTDLTDVLARLDEIEAALEELDMSSYGTSPTDPGRDCPDILERNPAAVSGFYFVNFGGGDVHTVECYMGDGAADEATFGAGWMKVRDDHAVNGRGHADTNFAEPLGYTYSELLFRHESGSATGGPNYPGSFPDSNPITWRAEGGGWETTAASSGSHCTTSFTALGDGIYLGADFSIVLPGPRTSRFQIGMAEGVASCTTSDNPGDATLDVWVR